MLHIGLSPFQIIGSTLSEGFSVTPPKSTLILLGEAFARSDKITTYLILFAQPLIGQQPLLEHLISHNCVVAI